MSCTFRQTLCNVNRPDDTLAKEFNAHHEKYESHFSLDRQGMFVYILVNHSNKNMIFALYENSEGLSSATNPKPKG